MSNNFNSLLVMAVVTKLPISNKNNKLLPGIIFVIILDEMHQHKCKYRNCNVFFNRNPVFSPLSLLVTEFLTTVARQRIPVVEQELIRST
jgi:hypothetical protein